MYNLWLITARWIPRGIQKQVNNIVYLWVVHLSPLKRVYLLLTVNILVWPTIYITYSTRRTGVVIYIKATRSGQSTLIIVSPCFYISTQYSAFFIFKSCLYTINVFFLHVGIWEPEGKQGQLTLVQDVYISHNTWHVCFELMTRTIVISVYLTTRLHNRSDVEPFWTMSVNGSRLERI